MLWLRASGHAGIRALEQGGLPRVTLGRIPHAPPGAAGVPQKAVGHDTVVEYLGAQTEGFQTLFVPAAGLTRRPYQLDAMTALQN